MLTLSDPKQKLGNSPRLLPTLPLYPPQAISFRQSVLAPNYFSSLCLWAWGPSQGPALLAWPYPLRRPGAYSCPYFKTLFKGQRDRNCLGHVGMNDYAGEGMNE